MLDQYKREINYMRISVTDRCNLRCHYCMPNGIDWIEHSEILHYEEILQVCKEAVSLGIVNFKITGGEPLVRRGICDFIQTLKEMDRVKSVTLTTNGVLLAQNMEALKQAGIDAVNISLDTLDAQQYKEITGFDQLEQVKAGILASINAGIRTRVNCVLLEKYRENILSLATLARDYDIDVRFIELMPIGTGKEGGGISQQEARKMLLREYPDLSSLEGYRGNGPARYESSALLKGRIGWIDALSHIFCESCNRVRMTSTGLLKPCLCYGEGTDLRVILRSENQEKTLKEAMEKAIYGKPKAHCFLEKDNISENHKMASIGG